MSSQSRREVSSSLGSLLSDNTSARDNVPLSATQLLDVSAKTVSLSRKTPEPHTEQLDDLAALFMPEILNHQQPLSLLVSQPSGQGIKEEDFGYEYFQDAIEPMQPPPMSWNQTGSTASAPGKSSLYYSQHPCQPGGLQNQANLQALDYPPVPGSHQNASFRGSASNHQLLPSSSGQYEQQPVNSQEFVDAHPDSPLLTQTQQYQLQLQRLQQHELYKDRHLGRRLHHPNEMNDPQHAFRDPNTFNSQSSSSGRYDGSSQSMYQHASSNLGLTNSVNVSSAYQPPQYPSQNPYYLHAQRHPQDSKQPASHFSNYEQSVGLLGAAYNRYPLRNYTDNNPAAPVGLGVEQANWPGMSSGSATDPTRQIYPPKQTQPLPAYGNGSRALPQSGQSMFEDPKHHGANVSFKKAKSQKHKSPGIKFDFDYAPAKLTRLLDFKKVPGLDSALVIDPGDYSIIDSNSNPVQVTLNGFLNGRFLTNDIDNNKYIRSRLELKTSDAERSRRVEKSSADAETTTQLPSEFQNKIQDARVVSCYRRNFIQISLNLKINGYTSDSKLLRLKSSELGYTITRVIKFLKVEIQASTNASSLRSVPVIILNESAKDEKDKKRQGRSFGERKEDSVNPTPVANTEMVVLLNDECEIENGEVNKYFVVKKLQFKSATPNNGNQTFQNYYHLRLKLIAVVADLYYNDPVSEVGNDGTLDAAFAPDKNNHQDGCGGDDAEMDNNEVTLYEVVSEPIIVRGRNPNFYTDRNNILIEGRSCSSKASFQSASEAPPSTCGYPDSPEARAANAPANSRSLQTANDVSNASEAEPDSPLHQPDHEIDDDNGVLNIDMKGASEKEFLGDEKMDSVDEDDRSNLAGGSWSEQNSQLSPMEFADARQKSPLENVNGYKYFPVSNVYYLPPINVVYFPHGAHLLEIVKSRKDLALSDQKSNSNVYFK